MRHALALTALVALLAASGLAAAEPAAPAPAASGSAASGPAPGPAVGPDETVGRAREAFVRGVALVRQEKWAEALAEFERSLAERPHPVTLYNVALCHRALGRSVRAVSALERALVDADRMPEASRLDARKLLDELRPQRAFVVVEVATAGSSLTVDGLPVERLDEAWTPSLQAGAPTALGAGPRRVVVEPGSHEVTITREGHAPLVRMVTVRAGESVAVRAALTELPGLLAVSSRPVAGWLRLNDQPVGTLPLLLPRPAGPYRLEVTAPGRVPFVTEVNLRPGARADVLADLRPEKVSLLRRWWFWTGVGVVVAGAAVTTYALTRPTEKADGGTLGWVVRP